MGLRVFDESGTVQTVEASPEIEAALRAGRLRLSSENNAIGVRDAEGNPFDVDPAHLNDWLAQGYRLESGAELQADHARRVAESNPSAATVAFGQDLGNELTWGLASAGQSDHERQVAEAIREQHPVASAAGTITGALAPALLTGGGSSVARGGLRTAAAFTPGGAAALTGSAVERALVARFGQGAASRAMATVSGAVADGALSGAAAAITRANVEGTPIEAERLLSDTLFGAALGLGGGALVAGGGAALRGAGRLARGGAERAASYAERLTSRGLGEVAEAGERPLAARVAAWASGVDPDDLSRVMRDPTRAFDDAGFRAAAGTTADSLGGLRRQLDDAGAALADAGRRRAAVAQALESVDGATVRATTRTALEAAQGRVRQAVEALGGDGRTAASRVLRGLDDDVARALGTVDDAASAGVAHGELDRVIAALDDAAVGAGDTTAPVLAEVRATLAQVASDAQVYGRAGAQWGELDGARRALLEAQEAFRVDGRRFAELAMERGEGAVDLARRLDDAQEALAAAERAGVDVTASRAALQEAREQVGGAFTWGEVRAAAERGLEAEGGHGVRGALMGAAGARGAKVVGGAIGALLGGGPGALVGAAAGAAWDVMRHPMSGIQRLSRLAGALRGFEPRLKAGLGRLERALSSGRLGLGTAGPSSRVRDVSRVVVALRGTREERRAEYRHVVAEIRELAADQDALGARLGTTLAPVGEASPELADAMTATAVRGLAHLAENLPAVDQPTILDGVPGAMLEPSQWEIDRFLRRFEAVEDPLSILDRAAEGSLHVEHRQAVEAVYPEVYAEIRAGVAELLGEQQRPPPYPVRLQLGVLMGAAADRSLQPSMIAALQSHYAQTPQQHEVVHGGGGGGAARLDDTLSESAATHSEQLERRL